MSLLREIQDAAVDANTDLPTLLRKCKVLAMRLGSKRFSDWVDQELNGYKSKEELPEYRVLKVQSQGHFAGAMGSGLKNAPIPLITLPEEMREAMGHSYLTRQISSYVDLLNVKQSGKNNFEERWDADVVAFIGSK